MRARFDNADGRIRGRKLQERRLRIWKADPHCAMCGRLVELSARPGFGFELDHKVALKASGGEGEDTDENTQVLCCGPQGCHRLKTARDMGHKIRRAAGPDGWPQGPS
jgi:5-methylcytosine-specific restriction endonuclease McrA